MVPVISAIIQPIGIDIQIPNTPSVGDKQYDKTTRKPNDMIVKISDICGFSMAR